MPTVDYVIVGQGIAGTVLGDKLMSRGKKVLILDDNYRSSSSMIAAGIVNPVTGRKYVKSWKIDHLIPSARSYYGKLEERFKQKFMHDANIIRILHNKDHQRAWENRLIDETYNRYIEEEQDLGNYASILKPFIDFGELRESFRVDTPSLILTMRDFFKEHDSHLAEAINFDNLQLGENGIEYQGIKAEAIIFCEGYKAIENPLFSYLPFQPAKGDAFTVEIPNFDATKMLRHKQFLVPLGEGKFWSGGGYAWNLKDLGPSQGFLQKWTEDMESMLSVKPIVLEHRAAVRPAVKGRRPLLGNHPRQKNAYIFNGMGTKGLSLVPFLADSFIDFILSNTELDQEVDIARFESLFT